MLIDDINKYLKNPSNTRLTIILESYKKPSNKKNLESLKLLIQDYEEDNKIEPVLAWLDPSKANEEPKRDDFKIELGPMDTDYFDSVAVQLFGDPKDKDSLGNRILNGRTTRFSLTSWYKPDVLLNKYAVLAGMPTQELDYVSKGTGSANGTHWEACILGTAKLDSLIWHK